MRSINQKIMQFFSSLADRTRLKILISLQEHPQTVGAIHDNVGRRKVTLSAISHQLRQLSDLGIVTYERRGREKLFRLSDSFCWCILRDAFKHFEGKSKCKECCRIRNER